MMYEQLIQHPAIFESLDSNSRQVLAVFPAGEGALASLVAWERKDDGWQPIYEASAVIGRSGFVPADEKREGDGGTPQGVYPLSLVFGYAATARTAMPYRQITVEDFWVDDPFSPQYNTWVHGRPHAASWETMLREDGLYRHGIVVEYNTRPVIAGKGSAIFVHLWRGRGEPTSGCVALAEIDLLKIIAWLEPDKRPVIVLNV